MRLNRPIALALSVVALCLTSCQTITSHQFASPAPEWQVKTGQLAFTGPKVALIGEVLVRYSKAGDLELTFSKGPGVNLLTLRQDASFASATGPLARGSWAGPTASAPVRLRGWFSLREKILAGRNSIQTEAGGSRFNLRF